MKVCHLIIFASIEIELAFAFGQGESAAIAMKETILKESDHQSPNSRRGNDGPSLVASLLIVRLTFGCL